MCMEGEPDRRGRRTSWDSPSGHLKGPTSHHSARPSVKATVVGTTKASNFDVGSIRLCKIVRNMRESVGSIPMSSAQLD